MNNKTREDWKKQIAAARQTSAKADNLKVFKGIHREQAYRASFFAEMAEVIRSLGLANPHERSALSIEPTHPVPPQHLGSTLDKLGITPLLRKTYQESKLSLISLKMTERYSSRPRDDQPTSATFHAPFYLLDPLYGFIFFQTGNRIHNHCFAIDIWQAHLDSMPKELSQTLWKSRADSMLSGGALSGRHLFSEILPPESDSLKQVIAPSICVNSEEELLDLIEKLKAGASKIPNVELWFRGQNREYLTPDRLELAKLGIAPYSNIRESDFTPSLYRKYDAFLENLDSFENLVIELAEWVQCAKFLIPENAHGEIKSRMEGVAGLTEDGISSYQRGLLLQQYGAPSAYLDITSDPLVAAWFATHRCQNNPEGKMVYERYSSDSSDPDHWPTLFVFPLVKGLHPYLDLKSILANTPALRPERQKCGLLGGAGNLARNYCARYLGLKIRLGPNFSLSQPQAATHFFPSATEDMALDFISKQGLGDHNRHFPLSELA